MRLKSIFEKHSIPVAMKVVNGERIYSNQMSLDQFEAAVKELMPSDEEIAQFAADNAISHVNEGGILRGAGWLRSHILGTDKKEG